MFPAGADPIFFKYNWASSQFEAEGGGVGKQGGVITSLKIQVIVQIDGI